MLFDMLVTGVEGGSCDFVSISDNDVHSHGPKTAEPSHADSHLTHLDVFLVLLESGRLDGGQHAHIVFVDALGELDQDALFLFLPPLQPEALLD